MAELDSVISDIKACIISSGEKSQSGIPLQQIDNDFYSLVGQRIPYRKLGFSSLEALFQSSGQFHLEHCGGKLWVKMVKNDKTQHLTDLIKKQKSKPPKKKKVPFLQPFNHYSPQSKPNYQSRNYQYPKNGHNTNYKPCGGGFNANYNNTYKTSQSSYNNNKAGYHNPIQPRPQDGANSKKMPQNYNGTKNVNVNTKPAIPPSNNQFSVNANSNGQLNKKTDPVPAPPLTSSCSSLESTYSANSVGHTVVNVAKPQTNTFNRPPIVDKPENIFNPNLEIKAATLVTSLFAKQNLVVIPSTAQSRLQKYPKKCEETLNKDVTKETPQNIQSNGVQHDNFTSQAGGNDFEVNNTFQTKRKAAEQVISAVMLETNQDYPVTEDINVMASRVKELLKSDNQKSGVASDDLERNYRGMYKENLMENWVEYLAVFKYFTCEKVAPNKMVIYLNDLNREEQPVTNLSNGYNGAINGTHTITNELSAGEDTTDVPGTPLFLNDYEEKSVLVSAIYSSICIYVRYVDENVDESYVKMETKFNEQMNSNYRLVEDITEGEFYAVLYESSWHRVQAASISEVDVDCYMIDAGETLTVSKDQICFLDPTFMKTRAQGIQCGLTQLENFSTFFGLKDILDEVLLNKKFVLVPDNLEDPTIPTVTLYETSNDMTNVNDLIVQKLIEKSITKLPSFEDNEVVNGTVSSVVASGHLYLQLNSDVVTSLEDILPTDCDGYLYPEYFVKSKAEIDLKKIYLAKYELDNIWSRVQVVEFIDDNEVNIIYIDYGNNGKSEITKLLDLEKYDPLMTKIPPQALKVTMNLLPPSVMTSEIANQIYEMVGSEKVLVNLINVPANDVPCIQLYKIQPEDDTPICLNIKLAKSIKKQ